jgi:hypothetical protein
MVDEESHIGGRRHGGKGETVIGAGGERERGPIVGGEQEIIP